MIQISVQMWLLVYRKRADLIFSMLNKDCVCTDAFRFLSKCKCDENMFWCENKHKTYSIVLMYTSLCGATYDILWWRGSFTLYGRSYILLLLRLQSSEHTARLYSMFGSEQKPITQWTASSWSSKSPVITLWLHHDLISVTCYIFQRDQ